MSYLIFGIFVMLVTCYIIDNQKNKSICRMCGKKHNGIYAICDSCIRDPRD